MIARAAALQNPNVPSQTSFSASKYPSQLKTAKPAPALALGSHGGVSHNLRCLISISRRFFAVGSLQ
jgi:hypothetical protein